MTVLCLSALLGAGACGGPRAPEPAAAITGEPADAGGDAGPSAAEERPFAASIPEATALISAAVDGRQDAIAACVRAFRERRGLAHEKVSVSFGIGQEGKLLGVTSKGKEDAELEACVHDVLRGALFPRSHAGVITVTKTYEEIPL